MFKNFEEFPDILELTDAWFKACNTEDIDGFYVHHTCRLGRSSGGCSFYVKNCWNTEPIDDLCISKETIEICTVMVRFDNENIYAL